MKFKITWQEDDAFVEQVIEAENKLDAMEQFFEMEEFGIEEIEEEKTTCASKESITLDDLKTARKMLENAPKKISIVRAFVKNKKRKHPLPENIIMSFFGGRVQFGCFPIPIFIDKYMPENQIKFLDSNGKTYIVKI